MVQRGGNIEGLKTDTPVPPTAAPPSATAAAQPTLAPPQPTPTFVRAVLGTIRMPDTGAGGGRNGSPAGAIIAALGAVGVAITGAGLNARRSTPRRHTDGRHTGREANQR